MEMIEIRVHVPAERETEFYRWFADWRDGAAQHRSRGATTETNEQIPEDTLPSAVAWWKTLTVKERAVWSLWLDAAPSMVPAERTLLCNFSFYCPGSCGAQCLSATIGYSCQ